MTSPDPVASARDLEGAETVESFVHRADEGLYAANRGGRNRIALAPTPPTPAVSDLI